MSQNTNPLVAVGVQLSDVIGTNRRRMTVDGNEAAASVAYRASETIAIYPITPSSPMAEVCDEWSNRRKLNLWGAIPELAEMQSEAGAAGAVHGALQAGALSTTFTASQGLLLMIPNMYKIAGELTPFTMHVAARTLATHALSIFGDHSDVMACRQTGFALLCSNSVQEAHDMAAVAHAATLESRIPFLHFFDGFRTSHEVAKIEELTDDDLRTLIPESAVFEHRRRGLTPDRPVLRGTAQNPDVFFQAREAANGLYDACPEIVERKMAAFGELTGRHYRLFEYVGDPAAERVIVLMGSGAETAHEATDYLVGRGEKVGILKVRLYRPFSRAAFLSALPRTVRSMAVLDRTKEPGATGDPLYLDVRTALAEAQAEGVSPFAAQPRVIAGRYGLSSKEFTPAMIKSVFDELAKEAPKRHFTVGIVDDVTHLSLPWDPSFRTESEDVSASLFYGLGADGTVGANKNSIKIIGQETDLCAQGYFVYDSKKSGAITVSHLRTSRRPIRSAYLVNQAGFVACHQFEFVDKIDVLEQAAPGASFLLNAPFATNEVWDRLPRELQQQIIEKKIRLFAIDAYALAKRAGMGSRINTIMQTCFFAITQTLPRDEAIKHIKKAIEKTYGKRGPEVVRRNCEVVDHSLEHLHEIPVPEKVTATSTRPPLVSALAPDFVQKVTAVILAGKGDLLPVSAFPVDGTWPIGTAKWEKRNIALEIPVWDSKVCIQCNQCALVCPHAAIRAKVYDETAIAGAPPTFKSTMYRGNEYKGQAFTIQVAPEDCTGCNLCVNVCPAKDRTNPKHKAINMAPQAPLRNDERVNYDFFLNLPELDRTSIGRIDHKHSQFMEPLFEYSGACAGCGETPYLKLLTQLFGDRLLIANATGCSSIYGGNLPTTPYTTNRDGRGPAWSNSLFEDNAEFGFGFRMALDAHGTTARSLLQTLAPQMGDGLVTAILDADQSNEAGIAEQRQRVLALRRELARLTGPEARRLETLADYLVKKSVWLIGGDGWAYDIGYGGLDHVLANRRDVNILVMDTEVYSNTGGQASKATPLGAAAKFAAAGKPIGKKDLGLLANMYGHVYVAKVAFGAKMAQTAQAFLEAESYPGPSLIIAYSHCIAHGYDMAQGAVQQKLAVDTGVWPLYRFDPRRLVKGEPPLKLDYGPPKGRVADYLKNESRFRSVERANPAQYKAFVQESQAAAQRRYAVYQQLAGITVPVIRPDAEPSNPDGGDK
jgi:pyruvate-ferredoxin/flavodoxin oxidoreductase